MRLTIHNGTSVQISRAGHLGMGCPVSIITFFFSMSDKSYTIYPILYKCFALGIGSLHKKSVNSLRENCVT